MYMPGTKDFSQKILNNSMPGLTSMVFCFEDACPEDKVEEAEKNVIHVLDVLATALEDGSLTYDNLPVDFLPCQKSGAVYPFCRAAHKAPRKSAYGH